MIRFYLCVFFFLSLNAYAQEKTDSASVDNAAQETPLEDAEDLEEKILDSYTESSDATQISEDLDYYLHNPVDINTASQSELERVPGLPPFLAKAIVDYRKRNVFLSVRDLIKVPGLTREVFVQFKDFVTVRGQVSEKRYDVAYRHRAKRNIEQTQNFRNDKYEGNIYQIYQRINATYQSFFSDPQAQIRAGAVLEKDPGERKLNDHQVGFIEIRQFPYLRKAVVGNYQLEFGQALALWSPSGMSKSSETIQSVKKKGRGISAYNYATENAGFFGAAAQFDLNSVRALKNIDLTGFYSYKQLDASFNPNGTVNSILTDGLHRDSSELSKKNYLLETVEGVNMDYRFGSSRIGLTFYAQQFDRRFVANDSIRNRYHFTGAENTVISFHHDIFWGPVNFFGEAAKDKNNRWAYNSGVQGYGPKIEWVIFYRNYAKDFQSLHGYAFGEQNGKTQNEEGVYTGVKFKPRRGTTLQAYYDIFRYPWRSFDVPKPVTGDDFLIKLEQRIWRRTEAEVQFKNERKDRAVKILDIFGREITVVEKEIVQRLRCQWDVQIAGEVRLRSRVERSWYRMDGIPGSKESGILFYEDIRTVLRKNLTLYGRLSFFDTHSFNTAIYEYENDLEGVFTNTAFSGKGKRWYLMLKYAWNKNIRIGMKYWELYRDDLDRIGSGGDAIDGNILRKASMSLDLIF